MKQNMKVKIKNKKYCDKYESFCGSHQECVCTRESINVVQSDKLITYFKNGYPFRT